MNTAPVALASEQFFAMQKIPDDNFPVRCFPISDGTCQPLSVRTEGDTAHRVRMVLEFSNRFAVERIADDHDFSACVRQLAPVRAEGHTGNGTVGLNYVEGSARVWRPQTHGLVFAGRSQSRAV